MLTFLKLGGSLITDKRVEGRFRKAVMARLAKEIRAALHDTPGLKLVIGHGSGSFGHFVARRYVTLNGVSTAEEWRGFAKVAAAAAELNHRVGDALHEAGVPIWRIQPSASAACHDGEIINMAVEPIREAIPHGLVPLVYGDVALDNVRGGTIISTEAIFVYLARNLPVEQIVLAGEIDGVFDHAGRVVPEISPDSSMQIKTALGGSAGVDVTGGMADKVERMLSLVRENTALRVHIINGTRDGLVYDALTGRAAAGTLIHNS